MLSGVWNDHCTGAEGARKSSGDLSTNHSHVMHGVVVDCAWAKGMITTSWTRDGVNTTM